MTRKPKLTEKQRMFCEEYIANGFNARQAYFKVYQSENVNKDPTYPYELLKKPHIQEYISERRHVIYDSLNIDAMRVIQELAEMAFASKDDKIYVPTIKIRALEQLSKNLGLQAQPIENTNIIEVKLEEDDEVTIDEDISAEGDI